MHPENSNYCFMGQVIAMQLGFSSALGWWQTCAMKSAYCSCGRGVEVELPCLRFCCRISLFKELCRCLPNFHMAASWSYALPFIRAECLDGPEVPKLPLCTETLLQWALSLCCLLNEKPFLCLLVSPSFAAWILCVFKQTWALFSMNWNLVWIHLKPLCCFAFIRDMRVCIY